MLNICGGALAFGLWLLVAGEAGATPTVPVVVGGLSNFDVTNITGKPEYEFEIELPSTDPASVASVWQNYSSYKGHDYFGTFASDGRGGTLITYKNATTAPFYTPIGFVEHFGVNLSNGVADVPGTTYTWRDQNNVPTDALLPSVSMSPTPSAGGVTVSTTVTNTTNRNLLIRLHTAAVTTAGSTGLQLANLIVTDPEILQTENEAEPGSDGTNGVLLQPGEVLGVDGEAHDPTDAIITNANHARDNYLARRVGDATDATITNAGDSALSVVNIFTVDSNGAPVTQVADFMQAIDTANPQPVDVPESGSAFTLLTGLAILAIIRRRCRSTEGGATRPSDTRCTHSKTAHNASGPQ